MTVIIVLFASLLFLSPFSMAKDYRSSITFFFVFTILVLIAGLRYETQDYGSYLQIYKKVTHLRDVGILNYKSLYTSVESGFALLILLEKKMFGHFFYFIFIFAFLSISIKYRMIKRFSPNIILSALLYLCSYFLKELGQIRNAMVGGLMLLGAWYSYRREILKFCLSIAAAFSIHHVAIGGIGLWFLPVFFSKKVMWIALLASIGICIAGGLGSLLVQAAEAIGLTKNARIFIYAARDLNSSAYRLFGGTFMVLVSSSFFLLFYYKQLVKKWEYNRILIPMYIYGVICTFVFWNFASISSRINELLCAPSFMVIVPSFMLLFKKKDRFILCFVVIFYCIILFYLSYIKSPLYHHYESILQFL